MKKNQKPNRKQSAVAALPPQTASVKERQAAGRALAKKTPLKEHGIWRHTLRRHDPIDLLIEDSEGRTESLLPIRYGRMMLKATDTKHAPWYILPSDDKERARLSCLAHILSLIPHKKVPREKVKLPKRSMKGAYDDEATLKGRKFVPQKF